MNAMRPPEVEAVIAFARQAMVALSERVLTLLGLLGTCAMFTYAMLNPDWLRFGGACAFAMLVFWPLMRLEAAKKEKQ